MDTTPSHNPCIYLRPLSSPFCFTLKREAARLSKTLVSYTTAWCHNPENHEVKIIYGRISVEFEMIYSEPNTGQITPYTLVQI
jgi:hypothetical protein